MDVEKGAFGSMWVSWVPANAGGERTKLRRLCRYRATAATSGSTPGSARRLLQHRLVRPAQRATFRCWRKCLCDAFEQDRQRGAEAVADRSQGEQRRVDVAALDLGNAGALHLGFEGQHHLRLARCLSDALQVLPEGDRQGVRNVDRLLGSTSTFRGCCGHHGRDIQGMCLWRKRRKRHILSSRAFQGTRCIATEGHRKPQGDHMYRTLNSSLP